MSDAAPLQVVPVVLAAGAGTRLGGPKALVEVATKTLLEHICATLGETGAATPVVVVGCEAERVLGRHQALDVRWVVNARWRSSHMRESLLCGCDVVPKSSSILAWPVDCPHRATTALRALLALASRGSDVVVPCYRALPGHPVLLSPRAVERLRETEGPLRDVIASMGTSVLQVPVDDDAVLLNVNTPADLDALRRRFGPF